MRQMDSWLELRSTIWKTLEYPLTCTTLTEKQYEQIMRPTISAGLAKSHICRSFPTLLFTHERRSIGRRPASPLYSPRYCTSEHFSVSLSWRVHYELATPGSNVSSSPGGGMWTISMAPIGQSGTTSYH
jgi:hypothetical protein